MNEPLPTPYQLPAAITNDAEAAQLILQYGILTENMRVQQELIQLQVDKMERLDEIIAQLQETNPPEGQASRTKTQRTAVDTTIQEMSAKIQALEQHARTLSNQPLDLVRHQQRPRLPDVELFGSGTHEEYTSWKLKMRAKFFGDSQAYINDRDCSSYILSRTKGKALGAISPAMDAVMNGTLAEPNLQARFWKTLDGTFLDPAARLKALEFVRTVKQGNTDFASHLQEFNLKLTQAGLSESSDEQRIDYLRNSLNTKLLRAQAGFQADLSESYESYTTRTRATWENLRTLDRINLGKPTYGSFSPAQPRNTPEPMDWQSTPVASSTVRGKPIRKTREYWGTPEEVQKRRTAGLCLRCGYTGHRVLDCNVTLPVRKIVVASMTTLRTKSIEEDSDDEEGKDMP